MTTAQETALIELARAAMRVEDLTKENFPHREPSWVYAAPDTPIKSAMNRFLDSIKMVRKTTKGLV